MRRSKNTDLAAKFAGRVVAQAPSPVTRSRTLLLLFALASAAGCTLAEDTFSDATPKPEPTPEIQLAPAHMRRLLSRQYVNAVRDLFGDSAAAVAAPANDIAAQGFEAIGASTHAISAGAVHQYESSARAVAAAARESGSFSAYYTCSPDSAADEACFRSYVKKVGLHVFRRPLADDEIDQWTAVAMTAAQDPELGTFEDGLEWVAAGMLQSPNFLYQIDIGREGSSEMNRRLDGYEMATRLAFFLTDTTPSASLLEKAKDGDLDSASGVRTAAKKLLESPAAKSALRGMYAERFLVRDVGGLQKDADTFPGWSDAVATSLQEEALLLLDEVVWEQDADWKEMLTAEFAYVDANTAPIYGVEAPSVGFVRTDLPVEQGRAGILTQGATMSLLAHPATTSPTRRGKFIQERLLCNPISPPPPDVDTSLPPDPPTGHITMRERLQQHQEDPNCASCHVQMDNAGLALEHFDAIGRWRADDGGLAIDDSGELPGLGTFDGARGLGEFLKTQPKVDRCMALSLFRHGLGRPPSVQEAPIVDSLALAFETGDGRIQGFLLDLVSSDAFRNVGIEP